MKTLAAWLEHAERVHSKDIDMGLTRVREVGERLGVVPLAIPAVIVAGTNGKGSTVTAMEAVLRAHGLHTGASLSPHLLHFGERVLLDGMPADEDMICRAFEAVDAARGEVLLTYFEYSTLVALWTFQQQDVDVALLEVGLGGRLDAFNIVDAEVSVITSIGLDHQAFLGDTLELIGAEKAGVMRPNQRMVLGADMPQSVLDAAAALNGVVGRYDVEFCVRDGRLQGGVWPWPVPDDVELGGGLPQHNQALAVVAAAAVAPLHKQTVEAALGAVRMAGRMERCSVGDRALLLDVAHNPAGAAFLRRELEMRGLRPAAAIYGAYQDKDVEGVVSALDGAVDRWLLIPTSGPRGQSAAALGERLGRGFAHADFGTAFEAARSASQPGDVILAFGSFAVVEAAHQWMSSCATV